MLQPSVRVEQPAGFLSFSNIEEGTLQSVGSGSTGPTQGWGGRQAVVSARKRSERKAFKSC